MVSQIDPSIPREGNAYTSNVRANFLTAQQEITALQDQTIQLTTLLDQARQDIIALKAQQTAASQTISAAPPATISSVFVTAGLDIAFTSRSNTRRIFTAQGSLGNSGNGLASEAQLVYGEGPPPATGTPISEAGGTLVGALASITTTKAGESRPFSISAYITDLVPDQPYWIGLAFRCIGGTAQLSQITVTAFELLDPLS